MNIFISYTREDAAFARKLSEALETRGLKPWVDFQKIEVGQGWRDKVLEAIDNANGFVFLLGSYIDRGQRFEMQKILEREYDTDPNKAMIPVVIGPVEMPGFLWDRNDIKLSSPNEVEHVASEIADWCNNPKETINVEKLESGRQAWNDSLKRRLEGALKRLENEDARHSRTLEGEH